MALHRYTVVLNRYGRSVSARDMHKALMSALPDGLDPDQPRSSANLVWHRDDAMLTVQTTCDGPFAFPDALGTVVSDATPSPLPDGEEVEMTVLVHSVSAVGTDLDQSTIDMRVQLGLRPLARGARVSVPNDNLHSWAGALLERNGIDVIPDTLTVIPEAPIRRTRDNSLSAARITCRCRANDNLTTVITRGLGRARSYGFGLVTVTAA